MFGTLWVCVVCALFALPIGAGTAILLEEFKPSKTWLRRLHAFVQLNISNLAGVPSVVYGILGLTAFVACFNLLGKQKDAVFEFGVQYYDQFLSEGNYSLKIPVDRDSELTVPTRDGELIAVFNQQRVRVNVIGANDPLPQKKAQLAVTLREGAVPGRIPDPKWYYLRLPFGRGVFAGALTLMLVVLPIVIIASQEALRAVPDSLREASLGMGASRWQTVWNVTLPAAIPGIMTGAILAMSRAIGEAAPVLMISGVVFIPNAPQHLMAPFTVMPLQIYDWAGRPQEEYHVLAALGITVLLAVLLLFNAVAVFIRNKMKKPLS
ncbi:MAG TPA: phosphate ABC transporter permease [Planctomycetaceae bacterium]|nr:phosphate ABC transporter permease [Blastopirellula sp.]HAY82630.1 phosphate ABC transporter permease [Planctomycetaceae bacterium]